MPKNTIGDGRTANGFDLQDCLRVTACCTSKTGRKWAVVRITTADGHVYDIFASKRAHRVELVTPNNERMLMEPQKDDL